MDQDEGIDTDHQDCSSEKSSFTSMDATKDKQISPKIDGISQKVQNLVEKINNSRSMDLNKMDDFQEKIVQKVTEVCYQMKEQMYTVYEENSLTMQAKLQELSGVLESCSKLNGELQNASQALAGLDRGLDLKATN